MSDLLWQGLTISVMGLGLTFLALGLLILTMFLLERLTRSKGQPAGPDEAVPKERSPISTLDRDTQAEEVAAAIAVALAHFRSLDICRSGLGLRLDAGHGAWWRTGRTQQQASLTLLKPHDGRNEL